MSDEVATKQNIEAIRSGLFEMTKPRTMPFKAFGIDVDLRELSRSKVLEFVSQIETAGKGAAEAGLIVGSVFIEDQQLFSEADIPKIQEMGNAHIKDLSDAILEFNGMTGKVREDAEKNSIAQTGALLSD